MKLTIESRDELLVLQSIYEGYKTVPKSDIDKYWEICETNESGNATKIIIDFDLPGVGCEYKNKEVMSILSFELLRIKHLQYIKKNKYRVERITSLLESNSSKSDIDIKLVFDVFLTGMKTSYYTSLMAISLHDFLSNDRDYIDLSAFAKFNTKGYNEDFDLMISETLTSKKEGKLESSNTWLHQLLGEDADNYNEMSGSPFEIMEQMKAIWDKTEKKQEKSNDIFINVTKKGDYLISNGETEITKEKIQEEVMFNYETEEDGEGFDAKFEEAMMLVLYCIVFLDTQHIYVTDEYKGNTNMEISEYLEVSGVYPKYNPYIIMKNKED